MKSLAILGSTGSIGTQTLDVVRAHPERFRVTALAAHKRDGQIEEQIREFCPAIAVLTDEAAAVRLRARYHGATEILSGGGGAFGGGSASYRRYRGDFADGICGAGSYLGSH